MAIEGKMIDEPSPFASLSEWVEYLRTIEEHAGPKDRDTVERAKKHVEKLKADGAVL